MNLKTVVIICVSLLITCFAHGQNDNGNKNGQLGDSIKVNELLALCKENVDKDFRKAIEYGEQAMNLSYKIGFRKGEALAFKFIGIAYYYQGNNLEAMNFYQQSLGVFSTIGDDEGVSNLQSNIGAIYMAQGDDGKALNYFLESLQRAEKIGAKLRMLTALTNVGAVYAHNDSSFAKAIYYNEKAMLLAEELQDKDAIGTLTLNLGDIYAETNKDSLAMLYFKKSIKAFDSANIPASYNSIGALYLKQNNYPLALLNHRKAYAIAEKLNNKWDIVQALQGLGRTFLKMNDNTSALRYFTEAESTAREIDDPISLMNGYLDMSNAYANRGDYKNAHLSHILYSDYKDTLYNSETRKKLANLQFDFDLQKKEKELTYLLNISLLKKDNNLRDLEVKRQRLAKNTSIVGFVMVFILAFFIYLNNKQKQKATKQIKKAYEDLKAAQSQLIQSEKMASLGELTAGIAHEIQNPLNFVNNFSEVSNELIDEMKEELAKGNYEDVNMLAEDVKQNLEKINHHGKRADAIVKGMIEHSRSSAGKKEPTDMNALVDEYLKLSYHGMHAKTQSFNAAIQKDYYGSIGKISIIPQEIGRALLNLFNNAFYAMNEKRKQSQKEYEPTVSVSTKKINSRVEVRVADNGNGIPQKVLGKIFQPFFTTKPTGQGTGLGLSLTYDIVKAHGGEIKVNTAEGEFAEFVIELPIT